VYKLEAVMLFDISTGLTLFINDTISQQKALFVFLRPV